MQDILPTTVTDTSTAERLSAAWIGTASNTLKVSVSTAFGVNDTFFTTTVTMENVGGSTLYEVEYMRNLDPDQEQVRGCCLVCVPYVVTTPRSVLDISG
jgi:hypothetical protein